MAKYLAIPAADGTSLGNAKLVDGETIDGLTNGTAYDIYRLSDTAASATPAVAAALAPITTAAPAISGTATVGSVLTASTGIWSGSPTGYAYQWNRNSSAIPSATAASYTLVSDDIGATITVAVTATNSAGATTAVSAGIGPVTETVAETWWVSQAYADIDYANDRAYINGTAYASITAARTAGALTATGSWDTMPLPATLASSFTVAATGVTGSSAPSNSNPNALFSLGDGDSAPTDEFTAMVWAYLNGTNYLGGQMYAGSASQIATLSSSAATFTTTGATVSSDVRMGIRLKANDTILSVNGTRLTTDTACTVPTVTNLIVGRRDDGNRVWSGTIKRVVFVNAEITEAALNALLA